MLSLTEFKLKVIKEEKTRFKTMASQGLDLPETFLAEEAFKEFLIESFSESVHVEDDIDLTEEVDLENGLFEYFDFIPSQYSEKYDVELEVDLDVIDPSIEFLNSLKEALFAEDYDVIVESEKANVVFSRAGGEITKKKKCGPGMKLKGNKCIAQTGGEKADNRKQGIVLKRAKRAQGSAVKKKAAIKATITKKRVASKSRNFSGT